MFIADAFAFSASASVSVSLHLLRVLRADPMADVMAAWCLSVLVQPVAVQVHQVSYA
jgi:hypothetical protein